MLIACQSCHRQYDVGSFKAGTKVRCNCGEVCVVPNQVARDVQMLHCASCGGNLREGAKECDYCQSEVMMSDRGFGDCCPECMARLPRNAQFCGACGTAIRPETIRSTSDYVCPRCDGAMVDVQAGELSFGECTQCAGVWLGEREFADFTRKKQASSLAGTIPGGTKSTAPGPTGKRKHEQGKVRYLMCPVCGERMNRKNFGKFSGVIIDWCRGHGYWFDTHELEQIMSYVQAGGLVKTQRRKEQEKKRQIKVSEKRRKSAAHTSRSPGRGLFGSRGGGGGMAEMGLAAILFGLLESIF